MSGRASVAWSTRILTTLQQTVWRENRDWLVEQRMETQADGAEQGNSASESGADGAAGRETEDAGKGVAFDDPRIAIGASPISSDAVAGEDVRDDPDFDALEAEFRKIETEGPNAVRWNDVIEMASKLLEDRTKDLMIATWLTFGLHRE